MSQTAVGRDWLGYLGKWMRYNARILQLRTIASYYCNCEQRLRRHTHKHTAEIKPRQSRRSVCTSLISISHNQVEMFSLSFLHFFLFFVTLPLLLSADYSLLLLLLALIAVSSFWGQRVWTDPVHWGMSESPSFFAWFHVFLCLIMYAVWYFTYFYYHVQIPFAFMFVSLLTEMGHCASSPRHQE